jgi:cell division protein DivIC
VSEFVDFIAEKEPEVQLAPAPVRRRTLNRISHFITNKFFIATLAFAAIMLFLDKNDLFTTAERRKELRGLEQSKEHYIKELSELQKIKTSLETDPAVIEKLAREKFLMKRDNEDIFLTEEKTSSATEKQ